MPSSPKTTINPKTICFKDFTREWCKITIHATLSKETYELTYVAQYSSDKEDAITCHPMYEISKRYDDESLLEGVVVSANPITDHMIECLMCNDKDMEKKYNTGHRPYSDYCGEIMRAMTHIEV